MIRSTITTITIAAAASTASASMVRQDITATASGSGAFAPLPSMDLLFSAEFDLSSSVLAPIVGAWTMTLTSDGTTVYTASGTGFNALTYVRSGTTRNYTMVFNNAAAPEWQNLTGSALKPSLFELGYTAAKNGTVYGTLGQSLSGSTAGGFLMVITNSVPGQFGAITSIGYAIPSPGAVMLFGLAGIVAARRRRS